MLGFVTSWPLNQPLLWCRQGQRMSRSACCAHVHKETFPLVSGTCQYVVSCGKKELRLHMEIRLLIIWPGDGEIIPDYPDQPNIITKILISEWGKRWVRVLKVLHCCIWRKDHGLRHAGRLWKTRKHRETDSTLESPEAREPWQHLS